MAPRQAVILAGGRGKRLRPHTDTVPKPMVPVAGRPIIDHQLRWLATEGVSHAVVACGYLAHVLADHLASAPCPVRVVPVVEKEPLGRGGGLKFAAGELPFLDEPWYALNGDIVATFSLRSMAEWHRARAASATVALTQPALPWGVARVDADGRVLGFEESPAAGVLINAGVYVFDPALVSLLPDQGDHERSTFPLLAEQGRLFGYEIDGPWRAVDSEKDREEAERLLAHHTGYLAD